MKINASNLPGIQVERVEAAKSDGRNVQHVEIIYRDDVPVGRLLYCANRVPAPLGETGFVTHWGWRPAGRFRSLTTKREAIERLLGAVDSRV